MNVSFSLQTNPQGKHQNDSHFAEGETEAQSVTRVSKREPEPLTTLLEQSTGPSRQLMALSKEEP